MDFRTEVTHTLLGKGASPAPWWGLDPEAATFEEFFEAQKDRLLGVLV